MFSEKSGRRAREGAQFATPNTGRPVSFNPEAGAKLVHHMRGGNFLETAAACIGRSSKTVRNWMRRGKRELQAFRFEHQEPFCYGLLPEVVDGFSPGVAAFFEALALLATLTDSVQWVMCEREWFATLSECLTMAEGEAEARGLGLIQKSAMENPQAAMWFLSRRYPDRWGQKVDVKASGEAGAVGVFVLPAEDPNG